MNYQRLNYPNGYKKVVQPGKHCPTPSTPQMPNQMPMPMEPMSPMPMHMEPSMPMPTKPTTPMPMEPMPMSTPITNNQNQPKLNLFPVDEGYVKGTIYRGLYNPYKNMNPIPPVLATEKDRMLFNVNKNHFAMTELQFYLNNFPNDVEALRTFNEFRKEYLKAKTAYEGAFGALDITSEQLERGPWNWVQTTAPWKRGV